MIPEKYFAGKKKLSYYLKYFFRKYFKNRFFTKIFLVNIMITVVACLILLVTLTQNLIDIQSNQSLLISDQILTTVDSYLKEKCDNAYSIHQRLYRDSSTWEGLTAAMLNPEGADAPATVLARQQLNFKVGQNIYSIDKDMRGIYLYSYISKESFQFGTDPSASDFAFFKSYASAQKSEKASGLKLVSSHVQTDESSNAFSIFVMNTVKNPNDFTKPLGILGIYFNSVNILQSYQQYAPYCKGSICIFDAAGNFLFDSQGNYLLPEHFPLESVLSASSHNVLTHGKTIYNILPASNKSYYIVNAYSTDDIMKDVRLLQRNIFAVIVLIFAVTLLGGWISTHFFSKRIRPITDTMEQIKQGHLTDFQIQKRYDDEIGFIYTELITMCAALDDHIQKEYVYQLHQKEMELYALQAQIDPHFLYNTLETIRMNLYLKGDEETSRMVYILSDMFRNSMKTDMAISIRNEMNYARSYLELYKYRFRDRMEFSFDIQDEVYRYSCIKHILQPILENALIHGIQENKAQQKTVMIHISATLETSDILFTISDDGRGISAEKLLSIQDRLKKEELFHDSIGIYNVNSRLRIVYGPGYSVQIDSQEGQGTRVTLRIKALRKKELEKICSVQ